MRTVQEINQAIMFGDFTNTELMSMIDAVKWRRATLAKLTKASLIVGDRVKFTSNRNGLTYVGDVQKVKIKFVLVKTPDGLFNVPANMLSKVDDREYA
jgi:hypothetical protein